LDRLDAALDQIVDKQESVADASPASKPPTATSAH